MPYCSMQIQFNYYWKWSRTMADLWWIRNIFMKLACDSRARSIANDGWRRLRMAAIASIWTLFDAHSMSIDLSIEHFYFSIRSDWTMRPAYQIKESASSIGILEHYPKLCILFAYTCAHINMLEAVQSFLFSLHLIFAEAVVFPLHEGHRAD